MRANLANANHCAVPFLSRAAVKLNWHDSIVYSIKYRYLQRRFAVVLAFSVMFMLSNILVMYRYFNRLDNTTNSNKIRHDTSFSTLSLPYNYIPGKDANRKKNFVKSNKLPIHLVYAPGRTLNKIFL